jgi:hypothetical protein
MGGRRSRLSIPAVLFFLFWGNNFNILFFILHIGYPSAAIHDGGSFVVMMDKKVEIWFKK